MRRDTGSGQHWQRQNQIGITQIGSDADDFDFEVSVENATTCNQQVNQAGSAFGK